MGKITLKELGDSYDWQEVFKYAPSGVERRHVAKVIASEDGENDGAEWLGVFKLKNGRFMVLRAGCDYTGWGCQEGGSSSLHSTREEAERMGLTADEFVRLFGKSDGAV